jgi:16S rRNA (cytidine1402-2'-O)-methyltransferase
MSSKLFIVPTPIGNLEDITLRALRVLKECDIIACEDTRQTLKLLNHFAISKPLISFYAYNQQYRVGQIIDKLLAGKNVCLVSDAGTPVISDPGELLVKRALENNIEVVSLPGPSALICALAASGLSADGFIFLGFLKRKPCKIKKQLLEFVNADKTIIFYESPHRLLKTLEICREIFNAQTKFCLARELSKKFEEFIRGSILEVIENLKSRKEILGEFVVMVEPYNEKEDGDDTKRF